MKFYVVRATDTSDSWDESFVLEYSTCLTKAHESGTHYCDERNLPDSEGRVWGNYEYTITELEFDEYHIEHCSPLAKALQEK